MTPETTEAFEIGPVAFWLVFVASVCLVALAFEQLYTFWRLVEHARDLGTEAGKAIFRGDLAAARTACERSRSPVADIFIAALNKAGHGESIHRAAERERQRFGLWMKRRLWLIGSVGALAPFVGLFGTVLGIIRSFRDIAESGAGGFSVVAQGVSQALEATAGGIMVAVMAVLCYNYFQARGNRATVEVKLVVDEFLEQLQTVSSIGGGSTRNTPLSSGSSPISRDGLDQSESGSRREGATQAAPLPSGS